MSVMIAMPTHRALEPEVVQSLLVTQQVLSTEGTVYGIFLASGCSRVEMTRTSIVHEFLKLEYERLFWIDSDIIWTPEQFSRLLRLSEYMPIVSGSYPMKNEKGTITIKNPGEVNEHGCISIDGAGLGFCVMRREAIVALANASPECLYSDGQRRKRTFRSDINGIHDRGEDIACFADLKELGFTAYVDPTCNVGHIGTKVYRAEFNSGITVGNIQSRPPVSR